MILYSAIIVIILSKYSCKTFTTMLPAECLSLVITLDEQNNLPVCQFRRVNISVEEGIALTRQLTDRPPSLQSVARQTKEDRYDVIFTFRLYLYFHVSLYLLILSQALFRQ